MFQHFLITRFNLRVDTWNETKSGNKVLTKEWLTERFQLFETYCLPSVLNQVNKNFTWLIFFDIETPYEYKLKIHDLFKAHKFIKYYFIGGNDALVSSSVQEIKNTLEKSEPVSFIITTRMDNDDMLNKYFIETIQRLFRPIPQTIIDLKRGFQLTAKNKKTVVRNYFAHANHFISLIELTSDFNTIFCKKHGDWGSHPRIIAETELPLWVEVIHKNNKGNESKNDGLKLYKININEFGLTAIPHEYENKLLIFIFNFTYKINKLNNKIVAKLKNKITSAIIRLTNDKR